MTWPLFESLPTEQPNPRSHRLDRLSAVGIVRLMNREDAAVLRAIARAKGPLSRVMQRLARLWKENGTLHLVGAGTSGRLAVLEAAECPPTFGTDPSQVRAWMAGGNEAVFLSREGAEDDGAAIRRALRKALRPRDVVIGIAASGVTAFVRSALEAAQARRCDSVLLTCNPRLTQGPGAARVIALDTGPEVLTGSTRLKAGTACKMALNILTTGSFVLAGKTYGNRMVDVRPTSRKLTARALRLIGELGGVSPDEAMRLFARSGREVKTAIVMARTGLSPEKARLQLRRSGGFLRRALA